MKNILMLSVLVTVVILASCRKGNEKTIPEFADIEFKIISLRALGDTTILEIIPTNSSIISTMVLKSDYTWTIDLGGSKSSGTYTWTPISTQQANIKFTILNWTDFAPNPVLSDKLKSALQAVNHSGYSLQTPLAVNYLANRYPDINFPFLATHQK
jgi:hypothetical protein